MEIDLRRQIPEAGLALFKSVVQRTWERIGSETLQMIEECEGRSYATWQEVAELVFDCDRWQDYGLSTIDKRQNEGFVAWLDELEWDDKISLFVFAFGKGKWS